MNLFNLSSVERFGTTSGENISRLDNRIDNTCPPFTLILQIKVRFLVRMWLLGGPLVTTLEERTSTLFDVSALLNKLFVNQRREINECTYGMGGADRFELSGGK